MKGNLTMLVIYHCLVGKNNCQITAAFDTYFPSLYYLHRHIPSLMKWKRTIQDGKLTLKQYLLYIIIFFLHRTNFVLLGMASIFHIQDSSTRVKYRKWYSSLQAHGNKIFVFMILSSQFDFSGCEFTFMILYNIFELSETRSTQQRPLLVLVCLFWSFLLCEKHANMEFFLIWNKYGDLWNIYSVGVSKNTDDKKLHIRRNFVQCSLITLLFFYYQ